MAQSATCVRVFSLSKQRVFKPPAIVAKSRKRKSSLLLTLEAVSIWLVYRLLVLTWRIRIIEDPSVTEARREGRPCIFAHWHGDELAVAHLAGRYRIATMTSTSTDGQIMDGVIRRLGGVTARGSSSRGGKAALKGLVRLCREGRNASVAVDGPRGPLHEVKPGVFQIARLTDGVVVPVGQAASKRHVFENSWNKAKLPWPFARVVIYFGPAQAPSAEAIKQEGDVLAARLGEQIHDAGRSAEASLVKRGGED